MAWELLFDWLSYFKDFLNKSYCIDPLLGWIYTTSGSIQRVKSLEGNFHFRSFLLVRQEAYFRLIDFFIPCIQSSLQ